MVDYKYKDLYNKPHIDKRIKIVAVDYIGDKDPVTGNRPIDDFGKIYLNAKTGIFYKMQNLSPYQMGWKKLDNESEIIKFENQDIDWENFELSESLCSESELRFGCCEASILKLRIHNTFVSLKNKWMIVTENLDGHTDAPFQFGRYKVFSDLPTADRLYRDITAYDAMYDIINASVIDWYNNILPTTSDLIKMKDFRKRFIESFGLEQGEEVLVNDDILVHKTIQVEEDTEINNEEEQVSILKQSSLSGLDIIKAICEINGCFGHIGRDGKFHYIYLEQDIMGLYPSNTLFPDHAPEYLQQSETGHLYPQNPKSERIGNGTYISADYEDYLCKKINKLQIREKENDIGAQWPEEKIENENRYIIQNNFLLYGKNSNELRIITKNIFEKIKNVIYRPFSVECQGNPCFEVGDPIRISTRYELIESYILKRTLKGIQSLRDSYSAEGLEKYSKNANSVSNSIIQLKGQTNILERNVNETKSEIKDVEKGVSSRITQLVDSITMSVTNGEKEASVTLHIQDGETSYDIVSDKINFDGLVSFNNLKNGGETVINGGNIKTGEINCDLLNGGKINGQTIEGGTITGATVKAKDGFYLQYTNTFSRPPMTKEYIFAKTTEGLTSVTPTVTIYSPDEEPCIVMGARNSTEEPDKFKIRTTPYFPNGAMIKDAYVDSLYQTYKEFETIYINAGGEEGTAYDGSIKIRIRTSGVFVVVYGTYQTYSHKAGERKEVVIGKEGDLYIPTYTRVRDIGYEGKVVFIFSLTHDGRFVIKNVSDTDLNSSEESSMGFRFEFFRI